MSSKTITCANESYRWNDWNSCLSQRAALFFLASSDSYAFAQSRKFAIFTLHSLRLVSSRSEISRQNLLRVVENNFQSGPAAETHRADALTLKRIIKYFAARDDTADL